MWRSDYYDVLNGTCNSARVTIGELESAVNTKLHYTYIFWILLSQYDIQGSGDVIDNRWRFQFYVFGLDTTALYHEWWVQFTLIKYKGPQKPFPSPTTIPRWIYRFSSDHRSQAASGPVSTWMGDRLGIPGVVGFCFCTHESVCYFYLYFFIYVCLFFIH